MGGNAPKPSKADQNGCCNLEYCFYHDKLNSLHRFTVPAWHSLTTDFDHKKAFPAHQKRLDSSVLSRKLE
jgi:hypothetical protein